MMHQGSAVVLVSGGLPITAISLLRNASAVYTDDESIVDTPLAGDGIVAEAEADAVVLLAVDADSLAAKGMCAAGAPLLGPIPGGELVRAAAVMDRLRSPGGCPWDAEQTHESLRQYLVEETYELLEAIEDRDHAALREELGDVLLQVLFHARVAAEGAENPFGIDEVAADLCAKLIHRHPHVFADGDYSVADADASWEKLKQVEKRRESIVDGVALGQPAVALAAKMVDRVRKADFPVDLFPGDDLFATIVEAKLAGRDPEGELRAQAKSFAERVRAAERLARADGVPLDESAWRRYWA
jgi:XTP/dITP diphosphohydrolase